ncbi:hypothetical protein [Marinobacter sp. AC-23]|uniref:hypothetical protein n=1 Tax=Marinobacter sp. AC-23 TaxID=1879031 RepID=UPI0015873FAB|nr:hypothetical protein [Marinobacter sp. AC-23]
MKLILLLAAVLVVGLLVTQQLNRGKEANAEQAAEMGPTSRQRFRRARAVCRSLKTT